MLDNLRKSKRLRCADITVPSTACKAKQAALILVACLSLVVSSLGACICPHHETKAEKPTLSCHSTLHEAADADSNSSRAEAPCICIRDSLPVILNKSERKRADLLPETVEGNEFSITAPMFGFVSQVPSLLPVRIFTYQELYSRSAPSRAPPRL